MKLYPDGTYKEILVRIPKGITKPVDQPIIVIEDRGAPEFFDEVEVLGPSLLTKKGLKVILSTTAPLRAEEKK